MNIIFFIFCIKHEYVNCFFIVYILSYIYILFEYYIPYIKKILQIYYRY